MKERITSYSCWWTAPDGTRKDLDVWLATEEEAWDYCAKIMDIYEKEVEGYFAGYGQVCEKGLVTEESDTAEWPTDKATVLLEEEYGYRMWVWHTGMTDAELIAFWKGLPSVMPYFSSPTGLPGVVVPCWIGPHTAKGIQTLDPKTEEAVLLKWPCEDDPAENRWVGHIHMDDDSGIGHPEYGSIHHAGYGEIEE
tara:strand:+ start:3655 stop:4239 length:585 start_codon:yes stop_codon:yes gene_type:complete